MHGAPTRRGTVRDFGRKVFSSSAATILSRLTGFVREVLLVALIGPSRLTDIFYFVYALPNMIRRVLGEGALVSAFLPAFTKIERENGTEAATDFASRVLYWQGVATGGFALLITLVLSAVWLLSEPGSYAGVYAEYGLVLAPYAFVICAVALLGAILNSRGIFFIPLSVQTVMNMVWIVVVLAVAFTIGPRHGLTLVGAGVVIACGLAVWYMARLAAAKGVTVRWTRGGGLTPEFRSFLGKFMLTLVGVASYPINLFADRLMAEFVVLREGAVTFLYQGDRLMQVPLGVIGLSIGSVALAALSAAAADHRRFHVLFSKTMTLAKIGRAHV